MAAEELPDGLSESEAKYWRHYAEVLAKARVLTAGDRDMLRMYVLALAMIDDVRAQRGPKFQVELRHWMGMARLCAADLGLTPASRGRVAVTGTDEPKDLSPLAQIQARAAIRRVK